MECSRLSRSGINILTLEFVMALMFSGVHSRIFQDAIFNNVVLQGKKFDLYDAGHSIESVIECSRLCWQQRLTNPTCHAFYLDTLTKTCSFYTVGDDPVAVSNLQVYVYQNTDRFNAVAIGSQQFLIYMSSMKKTFYDARIHCNELGGYLLQFDSLDEYDAVRAVTYGFTKSPMYVGANAIDSVGDWVTDRDNTPLDSNLWLWWDGNFGPSVAGENCVYAVHYNGITVGNIPCSLKELFLCEKDV